MFKKRLFHLFIVIAVVIVAAFVVREALAEANVMSQNEATLSAGSECASLPSRYSVHSEVVEETGTRLPATEDGPTGLDGGLMNLMSSYRTCSK
jgi:hypothetical protein